MDKPGEAVYSIATPGGTASRSELLTRIECILEYSGWAKDFFDLVGPCPVTPYVPFLALAAACDYQDLQRLVSELQLLKWTTGRDARPRLHSRARPP